MLVLVGSAVSLLATGTDGWWVLLIVIIVLLLGIACTTVYRVRVDATGLTARSLFGWPKFHYAPSRVTSVEVVDIAPMAQYGGWGLRMIPGSTGVVLRGGEALRLTLTNGRTFVITVDDAESGAALLSAVVDGHAGHAAGH